MFRTVLCLAGVLWFSSLSAEPPFDANSFILGKVELGPLVFLESQEDPLANWKSRKNRSLINQRPLVDFWLASIKISRAEFALSGKLESAPKKEVEVVSSAYYRPLKNQKKFAHGSYRKEVKVNGKGYHTFSGDRPRIGTVAADPTVFKLGTVLEIPGYGLGIVQDSGEEIKGKRIDLFMGEGEPGLERAIDWGIQKVQVRVLERKTEKNS